MADVTDIIEYYVNLLIIQYNNKPKARATIESIIDEIWASGIYQDVRDGYSVDAAVGVQLDIIGKYVGVNRVYISNEFTDNYFGFEDAANLGGVSSNIVGFDDAASPDKEGLFLDADDVISNEIRLNDESFRTLIRLKIIQNNSPHDSKDISKAVFNFFGTDIIFKDNYNMTITYLIGNINSGIIAAALQKQIFPKPAGVGLEVIDGNQFFGFADAKNLSAVPDYLTGFNDANAGLIKDGGFLDANNDII